MKGKQKDRPDESLDLFRCACYFYDEMLQEALVAEEIIPNMNTYAAILFLQEILNQEELSPNKRKPGKRARTFIYDYCTFYLAKNLPVILRQDHQRILKLENDHIFDIIQESLYFIVDARADTEIIIEFAADLWSDKNPMKLIQELH